MLLSDRPVYDPNPLRPNPNPKKPVSGSCRVRGLGQTLTPLDGIDIFIGSHDYQEREHNQDYQQQVLIPRITLFYGLGQCHLKFKVLGHSIFNPLINNINGLVA